MNPDEIVVRWNLDLVPDQRGADMADMPRLGCWCATARERKPIGW